MFSGLSTHQITSLGLCLTNLYLSIIVQTECVIFESKARAAYFRNPMCPVKMCFRKLGKWVIEKDFIWRMFLACLYPTKWNAFRFWASFPFLVHIVWLYFAHDIGLCGFWIDFPEVKHTWDFRAMSYTHLSHVQQHTKENSLSSIWIWVFAIRFLAMYHPTANNDLIVAVWLLFRDAIIPQPWSRHAKFMRREMVIYGGDWTEIMVVIIAKSNVENLGSVHCHILQ